MPAKKPRNPPSLLRGALGKKYSKEYKIKIKASQKTATHLFPLIQEKEKGKHRNTHSPVAEEIYATKTV